MEDTPTTSATYGDAYSQVVLDDLGACALCEKKIAYFQDVTLHNPVEHSNVVQSTISFVCAWNNHGFHIIPRPRFNADNHAVIQQICRMHFHPDTPRRDFHELLPQDAA